MNAAWLLPGHGCQYVGMGRRILRETTFGQEWLSKAEKISGLRLGNFLDKGPVRDLASPDILEPLLACIGGAYIDWFVSCGKQPNAFAGYSAGELMAMYGAGVMDAETCIGIAYLRGVVLKHVSKHLDGGMISISGFSFTEMEDFLLTAGSESEVVIAAHNSPRNLILSGKNDALTKLCSKFPRGIQTRKLDVAGPWHSHYLDDAANILSSKLTELQFNVPNKPVFLGSTGTACTDIAELRNSLARSLVLPVRWLQVIEELVSFGIDTFVETGPGHTLCGMLSQISLPKYAKYYFTERAWQPRLCLPLAFTTK